MAFDARSCVVADRAVNLGQVMISTDGITMQRKWVRARQLRNTCTDAERRLWYFLRQRNLGGYKFRRQYPIAGYIVDLVCVSARVVVELDGGQHADAVDYDLARTATLQEQGYCVLRFWNTDALQRTDAVLAEILRVLEMREIKS